MSLPSYYVSSVGAPGNFRVEWEQARSSAGGTFNKTAAWTLTITTVALVYHSQIPEDVHPGSNSIPSADLAVDIGGWPATATTERDYLTWGFNICMTHMQENVGFSYGTYWLLLDNQRRAFIRWRKFHSHENDVAKPYPAANATAVLPGTAYAHHIGTTPVDVTTYYRVILAELANFSTHPLDDEIIASDAYSEHGTTLSFQQLWQGSGDVESGSTMADVLIGPANAEHLVSEKGTKGQETDDGDPVTVGEGRGNVILEA